MSVLSRAYGVHSTDGRDFKVSFRRHFHPTPTLTNPKPTRNPLTHLDPKPKPNPNLNLNLNLNPNPNPNPPTQALIPLLDSLNHSDEPNVVYSFESRSTTDSAVTAGGGGASAVAAAAAVGGAGGSGGGSGGDSVGGSGGGSAGGPNGASPPPTTGEGGLDGVLVGRAMGTMYGGEELTISYGEL